MNNIAVRVEGLSKQYRIGAAQESYKTLRDTLTDAFVGPFRRAGKLLRGQATGAAELDEAIWALKDVSFEVKHGEAVGIIGRNGAGKSTLLKILSRITDPTAGHATIHGRVGSLLEVGTGFHPELTGRENIYLNGAILGMKRTEIVRKFDEMVAFAEIEKFIDTPVKHYSTGMYLRLAFAVAAHLEPHILLVDEVLAVGDTGFQKKCLGKMGNVAQEGRTVLLVSHNMSAIRSLCGRAILIEVGQVKHDGDVLRAISTYHGLVQSGETQDSHTMITFSNIRLNGHKSLSLLNTEPMELSFTLNVNAYVASARLAYYIQDADDNMVLSHSIEHDKILGELKRGCYKVEIQLPVLWLRPAAYTLYFKVIADVPGVRGRFLSDRVIIDVQPDEARFVSLSSLKGLLTPPVTWSLLP